MRIDIVSIFPEYFAPLGVSLIGKARERGILDVCLHQLRDWTDDVHRTVDDTPYGGGPGMVMKPEPWGEALDDIITSGAATGQDQPRLIVPTPSGRPFTQQLAVELAAEPWLVFACGRYEGIDSRVMAEYATRLRVDEVSIGDYVLAGGEVAVLVMIEAIGRLLPGVLGNADSVTDDSFAPGAMHNLVEGPVYTKPPEWRGHRVPDVLLSGHHGKIARWRRDQALRRTHANRPDLLAALDPATLDKHDRALLSSLPPAPQETASTETAEPPPSATPHPAPLAPAGPASAASGAPEPAELAPAAPDPAELAPAAPEPAEPASAAPEPADPASGAPEPAAPGGRPPATPAT